MGDRIILHIDMNAFYASVAQHLDPSLRGKAIAVAGDPKKRNGIILAKSRPAKAAGVKTGEAIWEAKSKCPNLIVVTPDYAAYKRYSRLARSIYYEYTDRVEPFGLDESWIDITGSLQVLKKNEFDIAYEIRDRIANELGLTVSVGVSWNKIFAKLGSDIDAAYGVVAITRQNYRQVAWPLPVNELCYVGRATHKKLQQAGIFTIGELAEADDYFLQHRFGKIGFMLRDFAQGLDGTPVRVMDPKKTDVDYVVKGIGNGLTAPHDLYTENDVKALVWLLSESVAQRLRESHLRCKTIHIGIRRAGDLSGYTRQTTLSLPTCLTSVIAHQAYKLICDNQPINREHAIRAIHVRGTGLIPFDKALQEDLFGCSEGVHKLEMLEMSIDELRRRFGNSCVKRAVELQDAAMAHLDIKRDNTVHPIGFLR